MHCTAGCGVGNAFAFFADKVIKLYCFLIHVVKCIGMNQLKFCEGDFQSMSNYFINLSDILSSDNIQIIKKLHYFLR